MKYQEALKVGPGLVSYFRSIGWIKQQAQPARYNVCYVKRLYREAQKEAK